VYRTDPFTQSHIDRLFAIGCSKPQLDKTRGEEALLRHLAALGLQPRPIVWSSNAEEGVRMAEDTEDEIARPLADQLQAEALLNSTSLAAPMQGGAWDMALERARDGQGVGSVTFAGWERQREDPTQGDGRCGIWALAVAATVPREIDDAMKAARDAARNRVVDAGLLSQVEAMDATVRGAARRAARRTPESRIWDEIIWWVEEHLAGNESPTPAFAEHEMNAVVDDAIEACCAIGLWAIFDDPATRRLADIFCALIDALEAGVCAYWIAPARIICIPMPALVVDNRGRLHREDGPAIEWPGESHHYWKGIRIPAAFIEQRRHISLEQIRHERRIEYRRVLCDLYGRKRYLQNSGATLVHRDRFGTLWRVEDGGDQPLMYVEVENASVENAERRKFFLRVPPTMRTAHEAVAWTFGRTPETYKPIVEA
jgi:hypothetical protein